MVDLAEIQTISYLVNIIGVSSLAVAVVIGVRSYLNSNKRAEEAKQIEQETRNRELQTKQAQLLLPLWLQWKEPEMQKAYSDFSSWEWKDYDDFMTKYGPKTNPDAWFKRGMLGNFFEGLGVFVKRGLIDVELIDDLMSGYVIGHWRKMEPIYREYRRIQKSPMTGENVEYLYNEVYKIYSKEHPELASAPQ
jgi:hypothetical protein